MRFCSRVAWVLLLLTTALVAGCGSGSAMTVVLVEQDYRQADVEALSAKLPSPAAQGLEVAQAAELRHDALADLRGQGTEEAALADLLTDAFPGESRSVPFHAEKAMLGDQPVWVVVEVWGPEGGTLEFMRTWAFARDSGTVVYSSATN